MALPPVSLSTPAQGIQRASEGVQRAGETIVSATLVSQSSRPSDASVLRGTVDLIDYTHALRAAVQAARAEDEVMEDLLRNT